MPSVAHETMLKEGWLSGKRRPLSAMVLTDFTSLFSNQLTAIAVPWFVLVLTGSATQTALTAAVTLLPTVVMTFFGGAVVDRMSARKLSIFSDLMSGVTVAFVPILFALGVLSFPMLLLLMFLGAVFDAPGYTARSTMRPRLAERAGIPLERINSAFSISNALSSLFGAVIAGVLVATLGATNVLWFNAGSFLFSAVMMLLFVPELNLNTSSGESLLSDIRTGVRYIWHDDILRTFILAAVVVNAAISPVPAVIMPYYANTVFNSAVVLGIILSGFGAGALIGSVAFGVIGDRILKRHITIISLGMLSLPMFALVALPGVVVAWVVLFLIGTGSGLVNPMVVTVVMKATPANMLGRVMGAISAGAMVAAPLGILVAGPLISTIGLAGTFFTSAVMLLIVLVGVIVSPALRKLDHAPGPAIS